jgi:AraC-like DNA-binding protein
MKFKFSEELLSLFRDFYTMTNGINISIYESPCHISQYDMSMNYSNCVVYPSIDMGDVFCKAIRSSRAVDEQCLQCDAYYANICHKSEKITVYRCHLDFMEAQIPIGVDGENAAILFLGQVSDGECSEEHFENIWFRLRRMDRAFFTDDKRQYFRELYGKLHFMSEGQFSGYCSFLYSVSRDWFSRGFVMRCSETPMEGISSYIRMHMGETIEADHICDALHISHATLYRILKNETGMGLKNYVNLCKMERAKSLLSDKYTVGETAKLLGYENVGYFSRLFRKHIGISPTEYRNTNCKFLYLSNPSHPIVDPSATTQK